MKIEIIIIDEVGEIELIHKKIKEENYDKFVRELELKLKQEGNNRHIEQVIIEQQPTQHNTTQHIKNDDSINLIQKKDNKIKHKKKEK